MNGLLTLALLVGAPVALHPATGAGQLAPDLATPASQVTDSADVLEAAKDAQRRFERVRIRHLPWNWGGWGGPCDERVGRMCWRHDDPEDDWEKPEEPEELIRERETLIDTLAALVDKSPGDRWILGQLVWYLGEADRWQEAAGLTSACPGADVGWCAALHGLALHELQDYEGAARAFDEGESALEDLGSDRRDDFRAILDRKATQILDDAADGAPDEGYSSALLPPDSLVWLLADPLYLVPGNERRTEHEARRVVNRIRDGARNPYSTSWGWDMSQLVLRYGWAVAWERVRESGPTSRPIPILGRHVPKGRGFIPRGSVLEALPLGTPDALEPVARRPRTTYRPDYAEVIRPAAGEVFVLDRGDSVIVLGAITDSFPDSVPVTTGSFSVDLTDGSRVEGTRAAKHSWTMRLPNTAHLVSLESLPDSFGPAHRVRRAFAAVPRNPGVVALSQLMILHDGEEPRSLERVAAQLRSATIRPGETVRVAWEVYGLGFDSAVLQYEVLIGRKKGGILSTVGGWIGVGSGDDGLLIEWTENQPEDPGPQLRTVSVTFPELEEGTYILRLSLQMAGRSTVIQERELEVTTGR